MMPVIKAVVFDMDGLLLDTEQIYFKGYRNARKTMDLPPRDDGFVELIGLPEDKGKPLLRAHLGTATHAFVAEWDRQIQRLMTGVIPVKPGVRDVVERLQTRGVPYSIATSTRTQKAYHHLAQAGLADLFPDIVGGDQVRHGKPAPDIYLRAAANLGIAPTDCAAFEDSENGVRAAVAAGMTTVQIPDIKAPSPQLLSLGHLVAKSLTDGLQMLDLMES